MGRRRAKKSRPSGGRKQSDDSFEHGSGSEERDVTVREEPKKPVADASVLRKKYDPANLFTWNQYLYNTHDGDLTLSFLLDHDPKWREQWTHVLKTGTPDDMRAMLERDPSLLEAQTEHDLSPLFYFYLRQENIQLRLHWFEGVREILGRSSKTRVLNTAADQARKRQKKGPINVLGPLFLSKVRPVEQLEAILADFAGGSDAFSVISPDVVWPVDESVVGALVAGLDEADAGRRRLAKRLLELALKMESRETFDRSMNERVGGARAAGEGRNGAQECLALLQKRGFRDGEMKQFIERHLVPHMDRSRLFGCGHEHGEPIKYLIPRSAHEWVQQNTRRMQTEANAVRLLMMCCAMKERNAECAFSWLPWEVACEIFGRGLVRRSFEDDPGLAIVKVDQSISMKVNRTNVVVPVRPHGVCMPSFIHQLLEGIADDMEDMRETVTEGPENTFAVTISASSEGSSTIKYMDFEGVITFDPRRRSFQCKVLKNEGGTYMT